MVSQVGARESARFVAPGRPNTSARQIRRPTDPSAQPHPCIYSPIESTGVSASSLHRDSDREVSKRFLHQNDLFSLPLDGEKRAMMAEEFTPKELEIIRVRQEMLPPICYQMSDLTGSVTNDQRTAQSHSQGLPRMSSSARVSTTTVGARDRFVAFLGKWKAIGTPKNTLFSHVERVCWPPIVSHVPDQTCRRTNDHVLQCQTTSNYRSGN
ncbi:hypothetical protein EDB80DRAFT_689830 [Ilyonectria destructans]|nr:hypothetical protein EDB80DRAFT_689830 [Ilyonectria destructans]